MSGVPIRVEIDGGKVWVNGVLVAEVTFGGPTGVEGRDSLEAEVARARTLRQIPAIMAGIIDDARKARDRPDHVNTTPAAKTKAYAEGFADGLDRKTIPYGLPDVPDIRPRYDPSYERGYDAGELIARLVAATKVDD